jgi:16S rRNA (adenine1518-N6/adenine1519-N6)-dimethyltransferase
MVQKEVAERITAQPNTKEYGALSVVCSLFTTPKLQFDVSKNCFSPVPKVTSSVVTLQRERLIDEDERLEAFNLSKIAFQQKRKKIKSALQEYFSVEELEKLGINPDDRPQKLTPEQYLLLAKSLK